MLHYVEGYRQLRANRGSAVGWVGFLLLLAYVSLFAGICCGSTAGMLALDLAGPIGS